MKNGTVKIAILQRGWIFVGRYYQEGEACRLENAYVLRRWSSGKGVGFVAEVGPQEGQAILDKTPTVRFHKLTEVALIDCDEKAWERTCPKK